MLRIAVGEEFFDNEKQEFVVPEVTYLELEHSLAVLSKWEENHEKPFIRKEDKSPEEIFSYILVMIQTPDFPPDILSQFSQANLDEVMAYIDSKMTATWFTEHVKPTPSKKIVTAEIIYHWMFASGLPIECEHWHLNKLITQIKVISAENEPPKKGAANSAEQMKQQRDLNARLRAEAGSKG